MDQEKKKRLKKILYFSLIGVLALVFIISAVYIANYLIDSSVQNSEYNELAQLVQSIKDQQSGSTDSTVSSGGSPNATSGEDSTSAILPEYQAMYAMEAMNAAGRQLLLRYYDSGSGTVTPSWIAR